MEMALRGSLQRLRYNSTVCFLSHFCHKNSVLHVKMSAADISDNPASQTKFAVVHWEVWHVFSSCFQRFQFDPNSSSQSVAWPQVRGERLPHAGLSRHTANVRNVPSSSRLIQLLLFFLSVVSVTGQRRHAQLLPESYPKGQVHTSVCVLYRWWCGSFCLDQSPDVCVYHRPTVSATVRWPVLAPLKRKGNSLTPARKSRRSLDVDCDSFGVSGGVESDGPPKKLFVAGVIDPASRSSYTVKWDPS